MGIVEMGKESCWPTLRVGYQKKFKSNVLLVTMVRSPHSHVYSQYFECRDGVSRKKEFAEEKALREGFSAWLKLFINDKHAKVNCYNPYNLQTRSFTCHGIYDTMWHGGSTYKVQGNFSDALKYIDEASFVGVTEYYQQSVCVLAAIITRKLPPWCDCQSPSWYEVQLHHEAHGVGGHPVVDSESREVLSMVDKLTQDDIRLYSYAMGRFMGELQQTEKLFEVKLRCVKERNGPGPPSPPARTATATTTMTIS